MTKLQEFCVRHGYWLLALSILGLGWVVFLAVWSAPCRDAGGLIVGPLMNMSCHHHGVVQYGVLHEKGIVLYANDVVYDYEPERSHGQWIINGHTDLPLYWNNEDCPAWTNLSENMTCYAGAK